MSKKKKLNYLVINQIKSLLFFYLSIWTVAMIYRKWNRVFSLWSLIQIRHQTLLTYGTRFRYFFDLNLRPSNWIFFIKKSVFLFRQNFSKFPVNVCVFTLLLICRHTVCTFTYLLLFCWQFFIVYCLFADQNLIDYFWICASFFRSIWQWLNAELNVNAKPRYMASVGTEWHMQWKSDSVISAGNVPDRLMLYRFWMLTTVTVRMCIMSPYANIGSMTRYMNI